MIRHFVLPALLVLGTSPVFTQTFLVDPSHATSSMTYRLVHPLHKIEATSKDVVYRLEVDTLRKEIKTVSAQVDVMTFNSGNSNRDSHAMEVIDAITYPDASFSGTSVTQTADHVTVAGKLTFHGVTKDVVSHFDSRWSSDSLVVSGGFTVSLTDYQIDRPSLLMIPVSDSLYFSLQAAFSLK
jgi:polyisoprenoid-binding protein YceI